LALLTQTKGNFAEKVIKTLFFAKNANFFAENWQKLQEIVIITSVHEVSTKEKTNFLTAFFTLFYAW
jgi:hypothetical protein